MSEKEDVNDWIARTVGFRATKDYRSARRAMRPQVGDVFVTRLSCGNLVSCRIDWVCDEWVGRALLNEEGDWYDLVKTARKDWGRCVMGGLRRGCEFRPVAQEALKES